MLRSISALLLALCAALTTSHGLAAQQPPGTTEIRNALAPLLPTGVRIATLTLEGHRTTVHGTTPSNAVLSTFMRSIDTSNNFDRVELAEIRQEGAGYAFVLSMDITCNTDPASPCLVPEANAAKAATPSQRGIVHKCKVNGALRFQDQPCAPGTEAN